jgi:hypothetical protein
LDAVALVRRRPTPAAASRDAKNRRDGDQSPRDRRPADYRRRHGGVWVDGGKSLAVTPAEAGAAATLAALRKPAPAVATTAEATDEAGAEAAPGEIVWWWD